MIIEKEELRKRYGEILHTTDGATGIIWVFCQRGFYITTRKGEYIVS